MIFFKNGYFFKTFLFFFCLFTLFVNSCRYTAGKVAQRAQSEAHHRGMAPNERGVRRVSDGGGAHVGGTIVPPTAILRIVLAPI